MIRTIIAFLCLVAVSSALFDFFDKAYDKNFKVRFSANPISWATNEAFMAQPLTRDAAVAAKWEKKVGPDAHEGYSSLELYCPNGDYTLCLYYESDTGEMAGWQTAFNDDQVSDNEYAWEPQGFRNWTTNNNGKTEHYKFTSVFLCSPEYLKQPAATRIASRDPNKLLQGDYIYVSGFNGVIYRIPTDASVLTNPATSDFTKQACTPLMGDHYYYNMTVDQKCDALTLMPWFMLVYKGQVVGMGFVSYLKNVIKENAINYFENPFKLAVKLIVPYGPECMYNLADTPGRITMHYYFIDNPFVLTCLDDWFG